MMCDLTGTLAVHGGKTGCTMLNQLISVSRLSALIGIALTAVVWAADNPPLPRIATPTTGCFYHGVYPGGSSGEEDDITIQDVRSYEKTVGCDVAWVYFSNNWYRQRTFPKETAAWIRDAGKTPFIRLMLRSGVEPKKRRAGDAVYTLQAISDGKFDDDLKAWAADAAAFGTPLIVEYGTECNGQWFAWNGKWNGGEAAGPKRFVAAYRHIVATMRQAGAGNITWVFHVDVCTNPDQPWNALENYYPGDEVIDWIGVSCYGPQKPLDEDDPQSFRAQFDPVYPRLIKLAPAKPIMVLEFGCAAGNPRQKPEAWAAAALDDILGGRWPKVAGVSWWNERWPNDDNRKHDTTMRVQDTPALASVFHAKLAAAGDKIVTRPQTRPVADTVQH